MSEHFIKEIEIKNYKLFKDFKASGFGRVNLIGGKNNVGKTAFMEACFIADTVKKQESIISNHKINKNSKILIEPETSVWKRGVGIIKKIEARYMDLEYFNNEIIEVFINIIEERYGNDFFISWITDDYSLNIFDFFEILIDSCRIISSSNEVTIYFNNIQTRKFKLLHHRENKHYYKLRPTPKSLPNLNLFKFITACNNNQNHIRKLLGRIKEDNKNDIIDKYLKDVFQVEKIDLTDSKIIIFKENKAHNFSELGDGIKSFVNIILTLLYSEDRVIYIDEIENGIHYTNLDKLWEIILTLSKEQNVQVFATTHSKECIESYARVAKKLDDKEIGFIELGINKYGKLDSIIMDSERLQRNIKIGNEVRGW